jgi:hypothetical protein
MLNQKILLNIEEYILKILYKELLLMVKIVLVVLQDFQIF